jgi:hypothetical protein
MRFKIGAGRKNCMGRIGAEGSNVDLSVPVTGDLGAKLLAAAEMRKCNNGITSCNLALYALFYLLKISRTILLE